MLSSNPEQGARGEVFVGIGTGREDPQPDSNPFQLRFAVKRTFCAELRGEAESKKAPLEGGWGVNPN